MLEWVYGVADRVEAVARLDADYQQWARQQVALVCDYEALLARLDPKDRELILDYTEAREGMLYRLAQLAWRYGNRHC